MHRINSDIASIQAVIQHLSSERSSLETSINSHISLLSPIRRLPNELLSEIFLSREHDVLLSANTTSSRPLTSLSDDSLWHIIQVCALWRSVAFSTPRLWNCLLIDLEFLKESPTTYACLQTRLQTCLSHSAALPLNFGVIGTYSQESANLVPLITTLCSHSHKWANVYFCPYATTILANWLPTSNRHLSTSQLVSLGLTSFNPSPGFIQISPAQFNHTPSLTRLALHDYRGQTNSTTTTTSSPSFCQHLTHLYLNSCPYYTYDDILSHVPSLTHLETFNKYQHSARSPTTTPIHLPNLITFKITGWLNNLCFLLPHLQIPSIQRIDIIVLEEECHPCTCGVVKRRIINEWIQTLGAGVQVAVVDAPGEDDVAMSADHNIITFLFSDI
jgi:hypothetical protein